MDQSKVINFIQEAILERLPDEAIEKLAELSEQGEATNETAMEILKEYGVDPNEVAEEVARKEL